MPLPLELQIHDGPTPRRLVLQPADASNPIRIGSDPSCELRFVAASVSPFHAELFHDGSYWCVRDCASLGGTYVDNDRLMITAIRLEIGQEIRIGLGEDAPRLEIMNGAADQRDDVDLAVEVSGFVKAQKKEWRRLKRWTIALPSAGLLVIFALWGGGFLIVASDKADRRAHPERYVNEQPNAGTDRLASIMSGEARPEDVDVKQIIADASFGRTSKIADMAIAAVRGAPGNLNSSGVPVQPMRTTSARASVSSGPTARAVDEASLAALIRERASGNGSNNASLDARLVEESQIITLRRIRALLEQRQQLSVGAAGNTDRQTRIAALDQRLTDLGIDPAKLNWQPGDDLDALSRQIDVNALERIRQKLVAAMSGL